MSLCISRDHRLSIKRPASDDISEKGEKQICFDFLSTPFFTLNRNISVQFSVCLNNCLAKHKSFFYLKSAGRASRNTFLSPHLDRFAAFIAKRNAIFYRRCI